nr:MAG TPA: hypothetical protein [Caudoviricetes sp.]
MTPRHPKPTLDNFSLKTRHNQPSSKNYCLHIQTT